MVSVEHDGITLRVRDEGLRSGETVVLLHGFPQDSTCWAEVTPVLHRAGLRTLAPDQRGYSPGASPADVSAYRVERLADDVIAVLDTAGVDRAHVVGHDGVARWPGTWARVAILLGAFVGLRVSEAAALRVQDMDYMRGVVKPQIQYPKEPLKSEMSMTPVPMPAQLALLLSADRAQYGGTTVVTNEAGRPTTPYAIERAIRATRRGVAGLPEGFRFHDLRHYLASLLIASGLDVKVVQTRLCHANATTTLNTYGHLWPDADESSRAAVAAALSAHEDSSRTNEAD